MTNYSENFEKMRIAGKLAAEPLDMLAENIKPEVFFDKETRFDFLVEKNKQKIFVEVKNVTLFREEKTAEFPDAVTTRG